ncbi:MAG TPA: hypothetical protein VMV72_11625 [Verrucomicrobiae bacterium]|nr:hypothetical protein [Verrucomicrobiae bacterium]
MSEPQKAYSCARPIRVAFLVNDHEHSGVMLDAIFANCMGRWGGRFSLIVPTTEAGPKESYLNWLESFDPDIIYSYVDLSSAAIEQVHERFYPSFLVRHELYGRTASDVHAYHPKLPIEGLKVTCVIPLATLPSVFNGSRNARFLGAAGRLRNTPFVQDSFGLFTECAGHSYFAPLNEFGSTLTLVADEDCQPRARCLPQAGDTVADVPALLDFAGSKNLITMSQLSAIAAPRLEIASRHWGNAFNIIVGDTFTDRVVYWNARSLFPKWRDREFVDLRIPSGYLADGGILDAIGRFLAKRNHVSGHSSGSTPYATIRSSSVPLAHLSAYAAALRGKMAWVQYRAETFATTDDCLPTEPELERAAFTVAENFAVGTASLWSETHASDGHVVIIDSCIIQ